MLDSTIQIPCDKRWSMQSLALKLHEVFVLIILYNQFRQYVQHEVKSYVLSSSTLLKTYLTSFTLIYRRRSRSVSPRRHKIQSPSRRRDKNISPAPRHYRRQRSTTKSPVEKSRSPSLESLERKYSIDKLKKEEEEKKRYMHSCCASVFVSVGTNISMSCHDFVVICFHT